MARKFGKNRSKASESVIYRIHLRGDLIVKTGRHKELKPYDTVFRLSAKLLEDNKQSPLSIWRNEAAPKKFTGRVPGFIKVSTFEIVDSAREDGEPVDDIRVMSFAQLEEYVETQEYPINVNLYRDSGELRTAIRDCEEDEPGFIVSQERLEARRGPEYAIRKKLDDLNNWDEELTMEGFSNKSESDEDEDEDEDLEDENDESEDDEDEDEVEKKPAKKPADPKGKQPAAKPQAPKGGKGVGKKSLADNI